MANWILRKTTAARCQLRASGQHRVDGQVVTFVATHLTLRKSTPPSASFLKTSYASASSSLLVWVSSAKAWLVI